MYMNENYGIENTKHFNEVMKGINLDDYIFCIEKGFFKYTNGSTEKSMILKKSDCLINTLFIK